MIWARTGRGRGAGGGIDAVVALVLAIIFLWLGAPFEHWAFATLARQPYDTGVSWTDGDLAGQPVAYFDLTGGAAWRDAGACATGVVLLAEGVLCLLAAARPALAAATFRGIAVLGGLGVLANGVAAAMQVRAGFTAPLFALVGGGLCVVTVVAALQRSRDARPQGA